MDYTIQQFADDLEKGENRTHYIGSRRFSHEQFIFDIFLPKPPKYEVPKWIKAGVVSQEVIKMGRDEVVAFLRKMPQDNQAFVRIYENTEGDLEVMDVTLFGVAEAMGRRKLTVDEAVERYNRVEEMLKKDKENE